MCELWLASYEFKHGMQLLFNTTFCAHLQSKIENYRLHADVLHIRWLLYYQRCRFSVLELDARYKWWGTPPNTHRSLFLINYFHVYSALRHITWNLQVICGSLVYWTTTILSETFFEWFRVALEIKPESYNPRHTSVVLWYDIVCIYCKSVYTSLFGTQLHLTTKLTYVMTAYM